MKGYLHSIESFSTLDGPGIRSVVFLQGCPLRCLYCHNPDTWNIRSGKLTDTDDILKSISRNLNFISRDGGVTISGGEPTLQIDFLAELLKGLKSMGLHTAVDTSGYVSLENAEKIIEYTDLFILDIKHMDPWKCKDLTGKTNRRAFELLAYLEKNSKDVWIRNVLVPGFTDDDEHIRSLCSFAKSFDNIKRLELLPYHDMAKEKYRELNIQYRFEDMPLYSKNRIQEIMHKFTRLYGDKIVV